MPRRPDGLTARSEHVSARFRPSTAAKLDAMRGATARSPFLERLVEEEHARRKAKEDKK